MLLYCTKGVNGLRINAKHCPIEGQTKELDSLLRKGLLRRTTKSPVGGKTTYTGVEATSMPVWGGIYDHVQCPHCEQNIYLRSDYGHKADCPARM